MAESTSSDGETKCHIHPKKDARAACTACGKLICSACIVYIKGIDYCPECAEKIGTQATSDGKQEDNRSQNAGENAKIILPKGESNSKGVSPNKNLNLRWAIVLIIIIAVGVAGGLIVFEAAKSFYANAQESVEQAVSNTKTVDLKRLGEQIINTEMTVRIVTTNTNMNGKYSVTWLQKKGSFCEINETLEGRLIYNANKGKLWKISGDKVIESNVVSQQYEYDLVNPFKKVLNVLESSKSTLITDDKLEMEWFSGKLDVEFKGPNGLPSKAVYPAPDGDGIYTDNFEYTLDPIQDSNFDLPPNAKVIQSN